MRFTPKTEAEIQEANLLPAGTYDFKITKAEDAVSKSGNDMIVATIQVYRPDGGFTLVTDYLLESMAYKLRHCCEECGIIHLYEAGTLMASDLEGREGRMQLKQDPAKGDFPAKNSVKDYGPGKNAKAGAAAPSRQSAAAPPLADEELDTVPF